MFLLRTVLQLMTLFYIMESKIVSFISNSKQARDNRGIIVTKFTFHGNQATAKLRGNDSIGGLYFFPRDKISSDRDRGDCNQFLRKASFSLFPQKSETEYRERLFPLWTQEPQTYYALFVDAATCYPQYPYQSNVGLELHLYNDEASGGHLSAEENGLKAAYMLLLLLFVASSVWFGVSLYNILSRGGPMLLVMQLYLGVSGTQGLALLLPTLHWVWYESNGSGAPLLHSLSSLATLAADLMMCGLVVDIVLGWTLGSCKRMSTPRSEKILRGVALLTLAHVTLYFYTASLDTTDPFYHSYSSCSELLFGAIWVAQGMLYLLVLAGTYQDDRSALRQDFYSTFAWIIIVWYISHPISQLTVLFMAEHNRVKVLVAICHLLRCCALASLANLFIKRSLFWEVSSLSATSLPFAERTFDTKDNAAGAGYFGYEKLTKRN